MQSQACDPLQKAVNLSLLDHFESDLLAEPRQPRQAFALNLAQVRYEHPRLVIQQ
jgi:hypothetical protein